MTHPTKYMAAALTLSTTFVIFNIIAVTQGSADTYYRNIEQFIISMMPTF
ncbi:MAG: hypothetical protein GQ549_00125 [Gammaproteobacteria bacterium]|nr:hypothetical protein [Gammaproteobacteria bacterium]